MKNKQQKLGFVSVLGMGLLALFTVVLYGGKISNPDYVWGHATRDLLGPVGFGLVGLMIACCLKKSACKNSEKAVL